MVPVASVEPIQATSTDNHDDWTWFNKLLDAWKRIQVSYFGGKYSIERLLALEEYAQNKSLWHVVGVCMGIPLPTVVLIVVQESIPLQDPRKGWQVNYGFWIRAAILAMVIARVVVDQTKYFIKGVAISWYQEMLLSICASAIFTAVAVFISSQLIFPVPFFVLTLAPIFYAIYVVAFRIVMGGRVFHHILVSRVELIRYISFLGAQNIMACTYPAYEALFRHAQGTKYQLPVIFLLPLIKIALKNVVLKCAVHMEDMTPEAVIFTVDFFNAVYLSSCMQSASSLVAVVAIIVTDLSQTAIMMYGLHRRTIKVLKRLRQTIGGNKRDPPGNWNLLSAPCSLCQNPVRFERQVRDDIRIYSCLPHVLSSESRKLLDKLDQVPHFHGGSIKTVMGSLGPDLPFERAPIYRKFPLPCTRNRVEAIHPILVEVPKRSSTGRRGSSLGPDAFTTHRTVLRESLEMLFSIECIIVTSYLEAATPVFYCCYVLVMVQLPSSRYHAEMAGITTKNVGSKVQSLFVFGLFQIASFILLAVLIKRNCGMHVLHHLAFVLETQTSLIQGKLMAWMIVTLCFRVVHFGVDFTFRFSG